MIKVMRILVAALLLLGLTEAAVGGGLDVFRNRPVEPWISDLAHRHVEATRNWARRDYEVWLIREQQNRIEIWVVKLRDLEALADGEETLGGGESFSLEVDSASQHIVREMHFQ
jgi:hypothetical protein